MKIVIDIDQIGDSERDPADTTQLHPDVRAELAELFGDYDIGIVSIHVQDDDQA